MIVRPKPSAWALLFILRGSIVPAIAPRVLAVALSACVAAAIAHRYPAWFPEATLAPFTLIGLTLSIFLSFRNNACYDRWWEARRQWGQLIVESRSLARECETLVADAATRQRMVRRAIGFAYALVARLRNAAPTAAAAWVTPEEWQQHVAKRNVPDALLRAQGQELRGLLQRAELSDILYSVIETRLAAMAGIQAACERILYTPLPFAYTLLLHRTAMVFCALLPFGLAGALGWATPVVSIILAYALFGLDRLGDELEEPFGLEANDLPLNAMARGIEIDLLEALGETDLPPPLQPQHYLLQ